MLKGMSYGGQHHTMSLGTSFFHRKYSQENTDIEKNVSLFYFEYSQSFNVLSFEVNLTFILVYSIALCGQVRAMGGG